MAASFDKTGLMLQELVATLSQAVSGERNWPGVARAIASTLNSSNLDWRDLARAMEQVGGSVFEVDGGRATQRLNRAAILAMQLTKGEDHQPSAEVLAACTPGTEPEHMLRNVLSIIRDQIPFDACSYSEYSHGSGGADESTFVQSRFALDAGEPFRWPARWIAIPSELASWAAGRNRVIPDVSDFYSQNPKAEVMRSNLVAREYERRGITSFLVAPRIDGGRVTAALTLGRRRNGEYPPFDAYDQDRLDAFRLELALRQIGEAYERRTESLAQDIVELFTPDADPLDVALKAVQRLGEGYGLEYAGLFRVNRVIRQFEVLAEYDRDGKLALASGYTQPLDKGMLSHVLREGRALAAPNVRMQPPPYDYISTRCAQASAMCLPIRLGYQDDSDIEWILDLESSQFDAFPRPEQIALKKIVAEVERSLQSWFEARLCNGLLNLVEQGVVVLGENTRIERANAAARKLLGLPRDLKLPIKQPAETGTDDTTEAKWANLEAFAADETTRALIVEGNPSSAGSHLRLKGPDGVERRALAGSSVRDEAFRRTTWLLGDVRQREWIGALRYMEAAVRTISGQAHGSLRLAGALLQRVHASLDRESPVAKDIDLAIRSIGSADLAYERVALAYDAKAKPLLKHAIFDLAKMLLRHRRSLPRDDAEALVLALPAGPVVLEGDPDRFSFALRSLLGYLLSLRPPQASLRLALTTSQGSAEVSIELAGVPARRIARLDRTPEHERDRTSDQIAYAEAVAVAAASHGFEAVQAIVEAHGGRLQQWFASDKEVRFTISGLPLASVPDRDASALAADRSEQ
jgi:PAS domain-containing protein